MFGFGGFGFIFYSGVFFVALGGGVGVCVCFKGRGQALDVAQLVECLSITHMKYYTLLSD